MMETLNGIDQKTNTAETRSNLLAPRLRFKEFGESWKSRYVTDLASKLNVGFVGTCEPFYTNSSEGVLLVRTGNLKGIKILLDEEKYVTKEFHAKNKKSQIFPGDLLLARHGGNGEICMVPKGFPDANSLNIVILRTTSELNTEFFQLNYSSFKVQKQISTVTAGSTQGVINTKEIGKLKIVYPTLPEQQKIASFLSAVDEKIQQLTRKKELLEQYKKGVMQNLFSGKLRFKGDDGKDFPDWEEKRLGDVAKLQGGFAFKSELFLKEGIPIIRISNISNDHNYINLSNVIYYKEIENSVNFTIKNGDLILAMSGATTGKSSIYNLPFDAYLNQRVGLFKSKTKELYYPFLIQFVFSEIFQKQLDSVLVAGAQPNVSSSDIESFDFRFPVFKEQQKIASYLSSIDTKIESVANQITQTQTYKKGLLQQMFV